MKYILLTLLALLLCLAAGWLAASLAAAHRKHSGKAPMRFSRQVLLSILLALLFILTGSLAYLLPYAHAEDSALACMESTGAVSVQKTAHGYYFDGPGEETAVLFVPGAKVDAAAYAPLLRLLAEGGADCYLHEPPFHMAFSADAAAEDALDTYPHAHWYTAGHSLGGVTASGCAIGDPDSFEGIVLLAAYPAAEVPDGLSVCSIYGSLDTRLDKEAYESHRGNFPSAPGMFEEIVIEGGNHAQFGDYGPQKGDSPATISAKEQQQKTADAILAFLGL